MNKALLIRTKITVFVLLLTGTLAASQNRPGTGRLTGKVADSKGEFIAGATVVIKGTNKGTTTDEKGLFTFDNLADGTYNLAISSVGFVGLDLSATVPASTPLNVQLTETSKALDEVIVTGVFDKRTKMESSVAISTLNSRQITQLAPTSAADLLRNVPGVYVNNARGEIANTVYSRGISANSIDNSSGYYYVSMQEDGLPVTNVNYSTDNYLRADITTERLEAVRGGTASILGANAPGDIFNYVSRNGGQTFQGEVRLKYGLEGNGRNPYYRADANIGGPLSKDGSLTYNIGGFTACRTGRGIRVIRVITVGR